MPEHNTLTGSQLHEPFHFVSATDPGAVGAGKWWIQIPVDESSVSIFRRNIANTIWMTASGSGGSGGYINTVPVSPTSAGTAGQYAINSGRLFLCYATNLWSVVNLGTTFGQIVKTYVSDGDTNGVFYFIGTGFATGSWVNPATGSNLSISASGTTSGATSLLTDRIANDWFVNPGAGSWINFNLGSSNLILNHVNFRQRTNAKFDAAADFLIEGSNNGSTWTTLMTKVAANVPTTTDVWANWAVTPGIAYKFFRIRQPASSSYFTIGELELYGTFTY